MKRERERETKGNLWTAGQQRECRDDDDDDDDEVMRGAHERKGEKEENIVIDTHTEMPMPSSTSEEAAYMHLSPY